jgi:VCBS repeat-containing protein
MFSRFFTRPQGGTLRKKMTRMGTGIAALLTLIVLAPSANAQLARMGPIDPNNGYPQWYQDKTGLTLEFCDNQTQAELQGGWCLLLPADVPSGTAPESFPNNFGEEHFYFSADAGDRKAVIPGVNGTTVILLISGLEGAFGSGPVSPGDQIVFARVRFTINPLPFDGDYTIYTPYGKFTFPNQVAGDKLFITQDVGLAPGVFTDALNGRIGPFLLPSATPGGPETAPVSAANPTPDTDPAHFGGAFAPTQYPGNGKSYIADPARIGPITGGTTGIAGQALYTVNDGTTRDPNIFRVEGPNGFVYETTDFSLAGRVYEGPIPGQLSIDRATYTRTAAANQVEVFATASPNTQGRLPAGSPPATISTQVSYFDAPCTATIAADGTPGPPYSAPTGFTSNQMFGSGTTFSGVSTPAAIPSSICVQSNAVNAAGQTTQVFTPGQLGDEINITQALYDPTSQTLSVKAVSGDQTVPQTLTVQGFGTINPTTGQLLVNPLLSVPSTITVLSSGGGQNARQTRFGVVTGGTSTVPVAVNDSVTTVEDTAATISVLTNDTGATGGTVTVVSTPVLGTASVNANGSITYTPNLNANGADTFTYTVTVGTLVSNEATVTVSITPVNDPPIAINDSVGALAGSTTTANVMSNDIDPDGASDLASVVIVTGNPSLGLTAGTVFPGGNVTIAPPAGTLGGNYTFTYNVVDQAGVPSVTPATVTVAVSSAEAILPAKTQFTQNKFRWVITGTVSPNTRQTMQITYLDGTFKPAGGSCTTPVSAAGTVLDTPVVDATNTYTWDFILPSTAGVLNPTNSGDNGKSGGFWCSTPKTIRITDTQTGVFTSPQPLILK